MWLNSTDFLAGVAAHPLIWLKVVRLPLVRLEGQDDAPCLILFAHLDFTSKVRPTQVGHRWDR